MKKLGFGLMRLPRLDANDPGSIDIEQMKTMVDAFLAEGFTYFDTAWMYCGGKSEEAVKAALTSRYPREAYTLATKLPPYNLKCPEDRDKVFEEQLRRTGVEYFDYYLLHDINAENIKVFEALDCFGWIKEKKAEGKIRHIGFSLHDGPELLDQVLTAHPEFEFVQLQINYLDWNSLGVQSRACYEMATRHGKPVIVMEPVKGGTLARVPQQVKEHFAAANAAMSPASWAVRFAATPENVMMVLSGMSDMAQLQDNMSYMKDFVPLTEAENEMVLKAAEIINRDIAIPCTECAYCIGECPVNVAIPQYFSLYNTDRKEGKPKGSWTPQHTYYCNFASAFGKASDCIGCGRCEEMCPQHLPIREHLKEIADWFEEE